MGCIFMYRGQRPAAKIALFENDEEIDQWGSKGRLKLKAPQSLATPTESLTGSLTGNLATPAGSLTGSLATPTGRLGVMKRDR
jgi:hypothetical protein